MLEEMAFWDGLRRSLRSIRRVLMEKRGVFKVLLKDFFFFWRNTEIQDNRCKSPSCQFHAHLRTKKVSLSLYLLELTFEKIMPN